MSDRYFVLSKKEQELMELFWDAGCPLARAEILERAAQRQASWKPNSVHILVNSLMDKGALQVAGYYLNSRKLGRTFEPAVTVREYHLMQVRHAVETALETGADPKEIEESLKQVRNKKKS